MTATHSVGNSSTTQLSTWFPSTSSATGEVIVIGIDATLKIDKSFNFTNSFFRCSKGAKIEIVGTGVKFGALTTKFFSCADMWAGITVMPGTLIDFNNSGFYNANAAISFAQGYSGTQNILRGNRFDNDFIGIDVGAVLGGPAATVAFTWCWGNKFIETGAGLYDPALLHVGAGIRVNTSGNLIFGTPQGTKNSFENIRIGIKLNTGKATIQHCKFANLYTPGLFSLSAEGTGISATKSSLTVSGTGAYNCVFENCTNFGVFAELSRGQVLVENASFTGRLKYCLFYTTPTGAIPVIFRKNDCRLEQFDCVSAVYCERPAGTSNTPNSQINNNHIVIPERNFTHACDWVAMIDVRSTQGGDNAFEISHNYLENFTKCGKVHGIYVKGAGNKFQVDGNRVEYLGDEDLLTINELGSYGIAFENMEQGVGNEIVADTVISRVKAQSTGAEVPDKSFIKCGVHVYNVNKPRVCNNYVNDTYRGFHLSEYDPGMVFGVNSMNRHVFGLHCSKGSNSGLPTDISTQVRRENTWSTSSGDYISGGVGAKYADSIISPFKMIYDPANVSLGHLPPTLIPSSGWFFAQSGGAQRCNFGTRKFEDSEIAISKNLYPTTTASASWDLQRLLWGKIVWEPGVQNQDSSVLAFYNAELGSSPHRYATAFNQFEQAFIPNTTLAAQINNALGLVASKEDEVALIQADIAQDSTAIDSTDAAAYGTAVGQLAVLRQNLSDLMDTYAADRDSKLATLYTAAGSLPNTDPWEKAWSNILDAAIKTGKGEELGTTERNALIGIANTCASDIGMAAQAVTTFMPAADAYPYMGRESSDGCISVSRSELSVADTKSLPVKGITLYPNPASNRIQVTFAPSSGGRFRIYNVAGKLQSEGTILADQDILEIDLSRYSNGLYFIRLEPIGRDFLYANFTVFK